MRCWTDADSSTASFVYVCGCLANVALYQRMAAKRDSTAKENHHVQIGAQMLTQIKTYTGGPYEVVDENLNTCPWLHAPQLHTLHVLARE